MYFFMPSWSICKSLPVSCAEDCPVSFKIVRVGRSDSFQTARIEGPLFHRGASASTKDYLAAPLPPLHLLLQPPYNIFSQA